MNRYKAAAIHFAICVAVAIALYILITSIWYPSPLFKAVGGLGIFLLVLACDVTIGPLLTLIVYKPGKPSLKFDLTVIALLQVAALCYGLFTLWIGRPVYVASLGHRFDVVQASEMSEKAKSEMSGELPFFGPKWVGINIPTDPKIRQEVMFSSIFGGGDYGHMPKYHAPLESMAKEMIERGETIEQLKKNNKGHEAEIDQWLASHGATAGGSKFQLLKARGEDMVVVFDAKTAKIFGIAPFKPGD